MPNGKHKQAFIFKQIEFRKFIYKLALLETYYFEVTSVLKVLFLRHISRLNRAISRNAELCNQHARLTLQNIPNTRRGTKNGGV